MRISDWSSDVCSSDLHGFDQVDARAGQLDATAADRHGGCVGAGFDAVGHDLVFGALQRRFAMHGDMLAADALDLGAHGDQAVAEVGDLGFARGIRSEEHTSELQSLMRISYAVFCLKKKKYDFSYLTQQQN